MYKIINFLRDVVIVVVIVVA